MKSMRHLIPDSMPPVVLALLFPALLVLLAWPLAALAQEEDDPFALEGVEGEADDQPEVMSEVSLGAYYLDDDAYRYGKFTGLTDEGVEAVLNFRIEKRPRYDSDDTTRWRVQGWRLGLDSRRLKFDFKQQGTQSFMADYREIPNNRFSDGLTPYRGVGSNTLTLPSGWLVAPGSNNTSGFLNLNENLANLRVDTKRQRLDLRYDRKLSAEWGFAVDFRHETKKGERTIASIFGSTGGNPRAVILPAPVDYQTDTIEAMFNYGTARAQFGFGLYASFFSNDETSLVWQDAFGGQSQYAASVAYPGAQGRLALEPDNSFVQFKFYGGLNLAAATRVTLDAAFGQMEQDDVLLPYTINPELVVHTPVPLNSLDAKIDTTMVNVRLTSQLARRLGVALNYHYDDRDNKTPQAVYPYIGGDSQDQRPYLDGRINLPYSYRKQKSDAIATYRFSRGIRLKGGVEYADYSREYSEVTDSDELTWLAGIRISAMETAAFNFDYRNSRRDVDVYVGNELLIQSHLPGTVDAEEWENHPLLRKYYLTDREREEFRFRADVFPVPELNFGVSASYFKDDYADGFFGLNEAKVRAGTIDFGWYPVKNMALTAFYTKEKYDASQSSLAFSNAGQAEDLNRVWFADTADDVDTYNLGLAFSDIGANQGWKGFSVGFDYTWSRTGSVIDVTAVTLAASPLPELTSKLRSFGAWGRLDVSANSSIRLAVESSKLRTRDFGLDNVLPDTLSNVLLLGESAANYDIILITGFWSYRF